MKTMEKLLKRSALLSFAGAVLVSVLAMSSILSAGEVSSGEASPCAAGHTADVSRTYLYDYDQETYESFGHAHIEGVALSGQDAREYPALAESLKAWSDDLREEMTERYREYTGYARSERAYGKEYEGFVQTRVRMRRFDDAVFSFVLCYEDYSGGAHGYYSFTGHTFDVTSGEEITLADVISDEEAFRSLVLAKLRERYQDYLEPDIEGILQGYAFSGGEYEYNWVMERDGISVMFNPYAIAPYAAGAQHIHIGFAEAPDLFTDRYHAQEGAYAYQVDSWLDEWMDLDGDGTDERFGLLWDYEDSEAYGQDAPKTSLGVEIGPASTSVKDIWYYDMVPLMMHTADGRDYLYVQITMENDYNMIEVFDLSRGAPMFAGSADAGFAVGWDEELDTSVLKVPMDPEAFSLETRMQMLSTYDGQKTCSVGEDGLPVSREPFYAADEHFAIHLKTVRDLPVTFIEAKGPADEGTETGNGVVAAGEELTIWRTDGASLVDLKKADGSIVRVRIDGSEWPRTIAGEDEAAYFEMLYYAG